MKEKEEFIKSSFLVTVLHQKGGNIVFTCVKGYIIEKKEDHKSIGIRGLIIKYLKKGKVVEFERDYTGVLI